MKFFSALFALMALADLSAAPQAILKMKDGKELRGEVLKDSSDNVVLDLGFTVLTVPRDRISELQMGSEQAAPGSEAHQKSDDIFYTEQNRETLTVDQNVKRVGEGVVQIQTASGLGSGFILNSQGHVITNQHVIAGEQELRVIVYRQKENGLEKQTYEKVKIIAMNGYLDLALLQIDDPAVSTLPHVVIGDSSGLAQGQHVFAIGSPLGLERTVSQGIISVRARESAGRWYIQTTTQINPGNSGGPLFNMQGEVVGVTNMKISGVGLEGVGFAIPATLMQQFIKNREAFAFDPRNTNNGFRYLTPPESGTETSPISTSTK
jgi:serine protease Do